MRFHFLIPSIIYQLYYLSYRIGSSSVIYEYIKIIIIIVLMEVCSVKEQRCINLHKTAVLNKIAPSIKGKWDQSKIF